MAKRLRKSGIAALCVSVLLVTSHAQASPITLTLSDFSSTEDVPADLLDATMTFSISGRTLTVDVANNTTDPPESFRINEIYFNATGNITDLQLLTPVEGWGLTFLPNDHHVDGFGLFDVALVDGVGEDENQIAPGTTKTFRIRISGAGPSEQDFTTEFSAPFDNHIQSLAAAKFINSGQRSAFGNVVPEPIALALLAAGGFALLKRRRRAR